MSIKTVFDDGNGNKIQVDTAANKLIFWANGVQLVAMGTAGAMPPQAGQTLLGNNNAASMANAQPGPLTPSQAKAVLAITSADISDFPDIAQRPGVTGVSLAATGPTTIFTTASGRGNFIVTGIFVVITAAATPVGTISVSVGSESSTYANVASITALTSLAAAGTYSEVPVNAAAAVVAPSTALKINITTALMSGTAAASVYVTGFYTS